MWNILVAFVDANKLGGWVRAGVASGFGVLLAKAPFVASIFTPELQTTAGILISGVAVGIWSHYVKKDS